MTRQTIVSIVFLVVAYSSFAQYTVRISVDSSAKFYSSDSNLYLAGSFNGWKPEATPLIPRGGGQWSGDLVVKPGRHEYLFVVDGQWLPDPNAKETVSNPFGGLNSVLIVSE